MAKIDFSTFQKPLLDYLSANHILPPKKAKELVEVTAKFLGSHLKCKHCGRVLADESFYKCKTQPSRRCRYIVCKICYKDYVTGGVGEKDSHSKK